MHVCVCVCVCARLLNWMGTLKISVLHRTNKTITVYTDNIRYSNNSANNGVEYLCNIRFRFYTKVVHLNIIPSIGIHIMLLQQCEILFRQLVRKLLYFFSR